MKIFTKKGILQKTILLILTVLCINFIVPTYSHAGFLSNVGGVLANAMIDFTAMITDSAASFMQWFMTGAKAADEKFRDSAIMVEQGDDRIKPADGEPTITVSLEDLDLGKNTDGDTYEVPAIKYTPEEIFSNKVPYLDINFINPKLTSKNTEYRVQGTAEILQPTISGWYIALRNLSIVGLLCVLVYVGIRIILSSTAADKAKHKQMFMDWLIALCLLFFLHYIMSFTLVLIDSVNDAIAGSNYSAESVVVSVEGGESFTTNVMGAARFMVQSKDNLESFGYLLIYIALVVYTGIFTYHYLKRALTMAFLTIIAPLVALTYPIDKIGDGKAQAFNMWLKEYIYTALIQPFHLIIYMIFVGSAIELVKTNFIFAIAAIGFILPAEKMLKKMFGFDKAPLGAMGPLAGFTMASLASKMGGKGGSRSASAPKNTNNTSSEDNEKPKYIKNHGTDGINYNKNSGKENNAPKADTLVEEKPQEKAAEIFAEQQKRQQEQEQQRQLEEQQKQLRQQEQERQLEEQQRQLEQQQRQLSDQQNDKEQEEGQTAPKSMYHGKEDQEHMLRGINNIVSAHGGKKGIALKGARTLGRAAKFTARTALATSGTIIGAGAGLASGKGIGGVIAGATAGRAIGKNIGTKISEAPEKVATTLSRGVNNVRSAGRNTIDTFNGNTNMNDKYKAKAFMKDSSTNQYIRDKWAKEHNGQAPTTQEFKAEKEKISKYADEGMTDIAQIYRARKAEKLGVSEAQSAKIALLAKDRKITSDVLGDEKKYNQRREDFTQEFKDKGFSETEAAKQADYVLNVMKAQNGQSYDANKVKGIGSSSSAQIDNKPRETRPRTNNTNTSNSGTTKPRTNNTNTSNSGTTKPRINNTNTSNSGATKPRTNNSKNPKGLGPQNSGTKK